jgi:hypothetical protein
MHREIYMLTQETFFKLTEVMAAYRELENLLPEKTCGNLLAYINADLEQLLPTLLSMNRSSTVESERT